MDEVFGRHSVRNPVNVRGHRIGWHSRRVLPRRLNCTEGIFGKHRATLVSSTSAGDAIRAEIERMWHDLEASTVGDLPPSTLTSVLDVLARVEANLSAAVAKS